MALMLFIFSSLKRRLAVICSAAMRTLAGLFLAASVFVVSPVAHEPFNVTAMNQGRGASAYCVNGTSAKGAVDARVTPDADSVHCRDMSGIDMCNATAQVEMRLGSDTFRSLSPANILISFMMDSGKPKSDVVITATLAAVGKPTQLGVFGLQMHDLPSRLVEGGKLPPQLPSPTDFSRSGRAYVELTVAVGGAASDFTYSGQECR